MGKVFVYIIEDERGKKYTGYTKDIERRLREHNKGYNRSTKAGRNWKLVFSYECKDVKEARRLEKYLKSGSFREKREIILQSNRGVEQSGSSSGS